MYIPELSHFYKWNKTGKAQYLIETFHVKMACELNKISSKVLKLIFPLLHFKAVGALYFPTN
jgi:hypothetical protein